MEEVKETEQNEVVLSDDELYAKIQTDKLLKKRKKRRIITSIVMGVALALAVCVIILAAVPASLKPRCLKNSFNEVRMYEGTTAVASFDEEDARFDTFVKYFKKSFSQTYLTAIFSGSLFEYEIDETYSASTDISTLSSLAGDNYLVRLTYDTEQKFTTQSGKTFHSAYSKSYWDGSLTFQDVYVEISTESGLSSTNIYILALYPIFDKDKVATGTETRLITVTVKADTNVIYEAWDDIIAKD